MVKDPTRLHGHRVVSGRELENAFEAGGDEEGRNTSRLLRRLRHAVVLILLLALIAGGIALVIAFQKGYIGGGPAAAVTPSPSKTSACQDIRASYVKPSSFTVNVYNAGGTAGQATAVAAELKNRQFTVGKVANSEQRFRGKVAVISGAKGHDSAFTVQRNIAGSDYFEDDRTDNSVDVVIFVSKVEFVPTAADGEGPLECPRDARK